MCLLFVIASERWRVYQERSEASEITCCILFPLVSRPLPREMDGLQVTVRLLDPPLHEFLPHSHDEMQVTDPFFCNSCVNRPDPAD